MLTTLIEIILLNGLLKRYYIFHTFPSVLVRYEYFELAIFLMYMFKWIYLNMMILLHYSSFNLIIVILNLFTPKRSNRNNIFE